MITQLKNIPTWAEGSPLLSYQRSVSVVGIPVTPPTYGELVSVIMGSEAPREAHTTVRKVSHRDLIANADWKPGYIPGRRPRMSPKEQGLYEQLFQHLGGNEPLTGGEAGIEQNVVGVKGS